MRYGFGLRSGLDPDQSGAVPLEVSLGVPVLIPSRERRPLAGHFVGPRSDELCKMAARAGDVGDWCRPPSIMGLPVPVRKESTVNDKDRVVQVGIDHC